MRSGGAERARTPDRYRESLFRLREPDQLFAQPRVLISCAVTVLFGGRLRHIDAARTARPSAG